MYIYVEEGWLVCASACCNIRISRSRRHWDLGNRMLMLGCICTLDMQAGCLGFVKGLCRCCLHGL